MFPVSFLLTRPSRDVTIKYFILFTFYDLFLLTRPSRDVTDFDIEEDADDTISTHTPLAGRDFSVI